MYSMLLTKNSGRIIGPIATLLGWVMDKIFELLSMIGLPNVGLAIIIMTILVNVLMLPLTYKQQKFSKLQRKMQPELNKIQNKYKGKTDEASVTAQQRETQEVYAKYGVNPAGSCVQLLIQMPILFGLYRVFYNIPAYLETVKAAFFPLAEELYAADPAGKVLSTLSGAAQFSKNISSDTFAAGGEAAHNIVIDVLNKCNTADWAILKENFSALSSSIDSTVSKLTTYNNFLGINISNSPSFLLKTSFADKAWLGVFAAVMVPVLAAATQFINIKMMPTADNSGNDQTAATMKSMNLMMPIMSAFFCYTLPAGMGIYWIASAVVRSIIQVFMNKHIDNMDIDAMIEKNMEKYNEKKQKEGNVHYAASKSGSSTRNYNTSLSRSDEKKLEEKKKANQSRKYKSGSLTAKANMLNRNYDSEDK